MAESKKRRKIVTPIFRANFVNIFHTESQMEDAKGKPKYAVTMVFDPKTFSKEDKVRWADMHKLADEASVEKFKRPIAKLPSNFKKPIRDGGEKEHLNGFGEGTFFAKASSLARPGIVAADRSTPIEDEEAIYSGCFMRATIMAYAYDNVGKGVSFGLQNLMFVRDGDRLDGRSDASEDFGEIDVAVDDNEDLT